MIVHTSYQKWPVSLQADYRGLPEEGPNYVARLLISVPANGVEVVVETFDYQKNVAIAASDQTILPAGTLMNIRLAQPLSSAQNQAGQEFQAILDKAIVVHARTAVPAGSQVIGKLVEVAASGRASGRARMVLTLKSIAVGGLVVPVKSNVLTFEAQAEHAKDTVRIGGGASVGAVIGGIAGGGGGAVKGALIGAGIGAAATLLTKGDEVEFGVEQLFSFNLTTDVKITPR
jgi:hypothetical protein